MKKKDRKAEEKKALELRMAKLRLLTQDQLADVQGAGPACTLCSCGGSCGAQSNAY